jgi:hypothetical protein
MEYVAKCKRDAFNTYFADHLFSQDEGVLKNKLRNYKLQLIFHKLCEILRNFYVIYNSKILIFYFLTYSLELLKYKLKKVCNAINAINAIAIRIVKDRIL